eukprot:TRINITY_DN11126_c0_g1_i1.p1 TRINITY_DN11126_c0_g1~~TRINITY_DN11126_c0_g1_i1.p1  ORF type:complete len:556 (+),score=101.31 TRINITY_DN11126_c0_g1_i1:29-1696(+)
MSSIYNVGDQFIMDLLRPRDGDDEGGHVVTPDDAAGGGQHGGVPTPKPSRTQGRRFPEGAHVPNPSLGSSSQRSGVVADNVDMNQRLDQLSVEKAREIDNELSIQDLISITFLMNDKAGVQSLPQYKLCKYLEENGNNKIPTEIIPNTNTPGAVQLHLHSAQYNNSTIFFSKLLEALYRTYNYKILQKLRISKEDPRFHVSVLNSAAVQLHKICSECLSSDKEEITASLNLDTRFEALELRFLHEIQKEKLTMESFLGRVRSILPLELKEHLGFVRKEDSQNYPKGPGFVLIFNNEKFYRDKPEAKLLEDREGTNIDRDRLQRVFQHLGASNIKIVDNSSHDDMKTEIDNAARHVNGEHWRYEWLAVCVLSHGMRNQCGNDLVYSSDGLHIDRKIIINKFARKDNIPNFNGKPRFFFFIACRNEERNINTPIDLNLVQGDGPLHQQISVEQHLVCSSTVDSHTSFRCKSHGSFYVQVLCDQLMRHGHTSDIVEMHTLVHKEMSKLIGAFPSMSEMSNNSLTRKFYFNVSKEADETQFEFPDGICPEFKLQIPAYV